MCNLRHHEAAPVEATTMAASWKTQRSITFCSRGTLPVLVRPPSARLFTRCRASRITPACQHCALCLSSLPLVSTAAHPLQQFRHLFPAAAALWTGCIARSVQQHSGCDRGSRLSRLRRYEAQQRQLGIWLYKMNWSSRINLRVNMRWKREACVIFENNQWYRLNAYASSLLLFSCTYRTFFYMWPIFLS